MGILYWICKKITSLCITMYFRKIHIVGHENIPSKGPVIFCCNHANQFIDAFLMGKVVDQELSFTMAFSSFLKPIIGSLARAVNAIPVKRPADVRVKGTGKIKLSKDMIVTGNKTCFLKEYKTLGDGNCSLYLFNENIIIPIIEIISDDKLKISHVEGLEKLFDNKETDYFVSCFNKIYFSYKNSKNL